MPRTRRVRDVMTTDVATIAPSATVEDAARIMVERRLGSVVVVPDGDPATPVGIVTETDFEVADDPIPFTFFKWPAVFGQFVWSEESMEELYEKARSRSIESVMSTPAVTVEADDELFTAVETMMKHEVNRLPVVESGRLVGIVSRHDLLKCLLDTWSDAPAP
jgi:CBS domain-containing protein